MKLTVDEEADALYLRLDESEIIETREAAKGIMLDYNDKNEVVGIEILKLSGRTGNMNYRQLLYETVAAKPV